MTIPQRKEEAEKLRKAGRFKEALLHYEVLWDEQKNEWNGYFFAYCLRKLDNYELAYRTHQMLTRMYPHFRWIKTEKLWLDYSAKVKDWKNVSFINDAGNILSECNQYDSSTSTIFIKTVLAVVKRLALNNDPSRIQWLEKLDQSLLDNKVYRFNNITYPADRKVYFIQYADALICQGSHQEYVENLLLSIGLSGVRLAMFMRCILSSYSFKTKDDYPYFSRVKLALYIKNLQEEINLRKNISIPSIYSGNKLLSVSDCSHFLFCPVSMAIHNSYEVYAHSSWEKDEWKKEKLYLVDRYFRFKQQPDLKILFEDTLIQDSPETREHFSYIFNSELLINNVTSVKSTIFQAKDRRLIGAPDYIFKHPSGFKFVLVEKFSHISSREQFEPYESDLIKPVAFLHAFSDLDLRFGLILNWFWYLEDVQTGDNRVQKKIVIKSYRLHKVSRDEVQKNRLDKVIETVETFRKLKKVEVEIDEISHPNKCLNCSVISYCHHKTGLFNELKLPYEIMTMAGLQNKSSSS